MTERPQFDPLSPFCRDVLALFSGALDGVRFPELDRARLEGEASETLAAQLEVERLERELEVARQRTKDAVARLTRSAEQALAYARVYATTQPAVAEALEALDGATSTSGPRRATEERPKKPRAPRAKRSEGELLPIETEAAAE